MTEDWLEGWEEFDRRATPVFQVATVTLQKKGMPSLNRAAFELLEDAKALVLLYNREKRIIALRPCSADDARAYPVRVQGNGGNYLVAGMACTQFYGIPTGVARRYRAEKRDNLLLIDLNQDAPVVTGPRARSETTIEPGSSEV